MDNNIRGCHAFPKAAWKTRYTGTVGRKRKNAVRTADSGIRSRGKAVLINSLPEPVTEVEPLVTEVETTVKANRLNVRWVNSEESWSPRMMVTSR
jgi:hypothetical protein